MHAGQPETVAASLPAFAKAIDSQFGAVPFGMGRQTGPGHTGALPRPGIGAVPVRHKRET